MLRFLFRRPRAIRASNNGPNAGFQTVKFGRPPISPVSKFVLVTAFWFLTIRGLRYLDPLGDYQKGDIIQDQLEKAGREDTDHKRDSSNGRSDGTHHPSNTTGKLGKDIRDLHALRFTVPVWIRKGSPRPYDKDDPEVLEFIKLQTDEKQGNRIKRQVVESVMKGVNQARRTTLELMLIGFNGKVSFAADIVPQLFVPAAYQVPCVWVSLDRPNIDFGWRELEHETGTRVERVFRPLVALDAASAAVKVFLYTTYAITKAKLGESIGSASADGTRPLRIQAQLPKTSTNEAKAPSESQDLIKLPSIFSQWSSTNSNHDAKKMHQDVVSAMPYSTAITQAAAAFNRVKHARQRAAVSRDVRGTCQVRGVVTFFGTQGYLKMEVVAHYLPAENIFIGGVEVKDRYAVQDYVAVQNLNEPRVQRRAAVTSVIIRDMEGKTTASSLSSKPPEKPTAASSDKPAGSADPEDDGKK